MNMGLTWSQPCNMDASGLHALQNLAHDLRRMQGLVIVTGVQGQPHRIMHNSGFLQSLGPDNCKASLAEAIAALSS